MAYEKQTWVCGETITADKLNHMEDGIAEASGGGTAGYECTEERTLLTEETVTTAVNPEYLDDGAYGTLSYAGFITADMLKVTFNGTEYNCSATYLNEGNISYGAQYQSDGFDWSEYPFSISSAPGESNLIATESPGTHNVKIEIVQLSSEISECFKAAVQKASAPLVLHIMNNNMLNLSFSEIAQAYRSGRTVLLDPVVEGKSWYSMVSLSFNDISSDAYGGSIIFGGTAAQTFTAASGNDFPTRA